MNQLESLTKQCCKCKKNLSYEEFEDKQDDEKYASCRNCRKINNEQSRQAYHRNKVQCNVCLKYYLKSSLKKHLWQVHDIGKGTIYDCPENGCDYKCKTKGDLKKHLEGPHDKGDKTCEICNNNVFKLNVYHDETKGVDKKLKICRKCLNRYTGYHTPKEKQMVEFIKKTSLAPYIILQNKIIKGASCNTARRPDLTISSTRDLMITVECDENQHRGSSYSCEDSRISEILDESSDIRHIFIRWNPDYYKENGVRGKVVREDRLKMLVKLIMILCMKKWTDSDNTLIYYMFYSKDNDYITKKYTKKMIYHESDFPTTD